MNGVTITEMIIWMKNHVTSTAIQFDNYAEKDIRKLYSIFHLRKEGYSDAERSSQSSQSLYLRNL